MLAAATLSATVSEARSDYKGLEDLQNRALHAVSHRASLYAGVHRQIRGRAPPGFRVSKVKGHASLDDSMTAEDKFNAVGNDFADRTAKAAAARLPRPSDAELAEWQQQQSFLRKYVRYVPEALMKWIAVNPSQGHKSLPKRADGAQRARTSFIGDFLGSLRPSDQVEPGSTARPSVAAVPPEGSAASGPSTDRRREDYMQVEPAASSSAHSAAEPPEAPTASLRSGRPEPLKHTWRWQAGRWLCTNCLATSRTTVPRQIFGCLGLAPNIRSLLQRPQGHRLQIATFTSGAGIVVICSGCGRFTTSNRRGVLHKEVP